MILNARNMTTNKEIQNILTYLLRNTKEYTQGGGNIISFIPGVSHYNFIIPEVSIIYQAYKFTTETIYIKSLHQPRDDSSAPSSNAFRRMS